MQNRKSIAIFDSGIGGLTLLKDCFMGMHGVDFIYLADNSNMPYGNKSEEQIYSSTNTILKLLQGYKLDALLLACNTATAICIDRLREENPYKCQIFGVEPAILPAIKASYQGQKYANKSGKHRANKCGDNKHIYNKYSGTIKADKNLPLLLLATTATLQSARVQNLLQKNCKEHQVVCFAATELAGVIESNILQLDKINWADYLPQGQFGGIILGCTHYIHIQKYIQHHYKSKIFTGNVGTVNHMQKKLGIPQNVVDILPNTVQFIGKNSDFNAKIFKNMVNIDSKKIDNFSNFF